MPDGVFCKTCGTPISELPPEDTPCPSCGSRLRNYVLDAEPGHYTLTGRNADLVISATPELLLRKAQELIASNEFSIAIVVTHMACEISAEGAISRAFKAKGIGYLEDSVDGLLSSYNVANDRVRNLYNALLGRQIQHEPFWQAFKNSAQLRNDIVHEARVAMRADAEASYKAASDLVAYLK